MIRPCLARWTKGPSKGSRHQRHQWHYGVCRWCGMFRDMAYERKPKTSLSTEVAQSSSEEEVSKEQP